MISRHTVNKHLFAVVLGIIKERMSSQLDVDIQEDFLVIPILFEVALNKLCRDVARNVSTGHNKVHLDQETVLALKSKKYS